MSKMTPEIRFKGFDEEWISLPIAKVAPLQRGFDLPASMIVSGPYPIVYSNGIINYHNNYKCKAPGLITGRSGTIGKFTYIQDGFYWPHNTSLWVTDFCGNIPLYILYLYQTINLERFKSGSGVPTLNRNDVHEFKTLLSNNTDEQLYIGKYFHCLDRILGILEREITRLEKMKLASLQKMFPRPGETVPEIRFKGFNEPWQIEKLGKLAKKTTEKNNQLIYTEIFTCSAEYGIVNQRDYFDHNIAKADKINGYQIVEPNVFVYNPRVSTIAPYGPIIRNKTERTGVISPLYTLFKFTETISYEYLDWYFKTSYWHEFMKLNGDNGARHDRFSIGTELFFDMPIVLPSLTEQQKVAEYFENLETILAAKRQKLEKLRNIKKACLEKMFVNNTTEQ